MRLSVLLVLLTAATGWGCTGGARGAMDVAVAVKTCPEVSQFVGRAAADWSSTLGIEPSDAATLKSAVQASSAIEQQLAGLDTRLNSACSGLLAELAEPALEQAPPAASLGSETTEQLCGRATRRLAEAKAQLGAEAKVSASKAEGSVAVEVTGASDEQAAARYQRSSQAFLDALLALHEAQANAKELIGNARSAIELGVVTGQAVSAGDAASAAASAVCILPPLLEAKQRIAVLRRDLRLLNELARLAGLALPRPAAFDEPVVAHATVGRGAPPIVPAPISQRFTELFTFPDGGLAAQTPSGVISVPDGQLLLRTRPETRAAEVSFLGGARGGGDVQCAVGVGRRVACIRTSAIYDQNRQLQGSQLMVLDPSGGVVVPARVSARGSLLPDGIAFDASGQLIYAYTLRDVHQNRSYEYSRVVKGGAQLQLPFVPEHGALEDIGAGGRSRRPITFFEFRGRMQMLYRDGRTLLLSPLEQPAARVELAKVSAYDVRAVTGGDGTLYVFYYDSKSRTARVAVSSDGVRFRDLVLDTRESGWQLDAVPTDDGALVVYYYFRSSYNKGLRAAALRGGKLARAPQSIMREDRWNAGWHPHLVSDGARGAWLTYLSNVEAETRVWTRLNDPKELLDYATAGPEGEPDEYKDWFLQAGIGGWYTWWGLADVAPKPEEVDGATLHEARYHVEPSLLLAANLEGRYGPVNVGLSYAQNYLDDAAKKLGEANRLLSGSVKIEDVLPGHDVKVEGVWGRYHGRVTRPVDGEEDEELPLDTSYLDVRLFALNQWRIKYGLIFNRFVAPTPVMAYYAPKTQPRYLFAESALRDVTFNNVDLAIGYSKLDYLAKYENDYFGPILDGGLAAGLSFASFAAIPTPAGDVTSEVGFHARASVQAGWLAMGRARSLGGLGFYVRPSYLAELGVLTAGLSRPKDREQKQADERADTSASFWLYSLRHGPWLDAGVVW